MVTTSNYYSSLFFVHSSLIMCVCGVKISPPCAVTDLEDVFDSVLKCGLKYSHSKVRIEQGVGIIEFNKKRGFILIIV